MYECKYILRIFFIPFLFMAVSFFEQLPVVNADSFRTYMGGPL
jgi:hypothetical protein